MTYLNVRTTLAGEGFMLHGSGETATDPPPGLAVQSQSPEVASASLKPNHCGE